MIQKISSNEYLKRVDKMTAAEKRSLIDKVGQWLRSAGRMLKARAADPMARLQNVMQLSGGWNDAECQAWTEGVKLLTAFVAVRDTWLPEMIYNKAAKRAIKRIHDVLSGAMADKDIISGPVPRSTVNKGAASKAKEQYAVDKSAIKQEQNGAGSGSAEREQARQKTNGSVTQKAEEKPIVPMKNSMPEVVRPKHIDQYVHLMPKKTQEKAATVRGLLRDLDTARENMRKLMESGEQSDKTAQWARTATKIDEKVKKIYQELDAEWEKLVKTGVVSIDAFGNAVVKTPPTVEKTDPEKEPEKKKGGRPPMTDEAKAAKKAEKEEKKKADNARKAALIRKWLIDTRNANTDEQKKKWSAKYKEMVKLAGMDSVTEKVLEAAKYYDINIEEMKG